MASPGGGITQNSSSEEEMLIQIMDERKRKRKESNRESGRRSRMRKQKHLDDLMTQFGNLMKTNNQLLNNINITSQQFLKIEAENSILRAQISELSNRLESLNEITNALNSCNNTQNMGVFWGEEQEGLFPIIPEPFTSDGFLINPWDSAAYLYQPIIASANMFQY